VLRIAAAIIGKRFLNINYYAHAREGSRMKHADAIDVAALYITAIEMSKMQFLLYVWISVKGMTRMISPHN
jgi:hypothetical protein